MLRLKQAHRGQTAVVIFGGPSLLAQGFDFTSLKDRGFVTFLETKALTPGFLATGLVPDYYLMLFPDKTKDNSLQHFVYRSFLALYNIEPMLRAPHRETAAWMREHFSEYFEPWNLIKGPHKRYRYKTGVFLKDSPYDLLRHLPNTRVILNRRLRGLHFPTFAYEAQSHYFEYTAEEPRFDLEKYFNPIERNGEVVLRCADTFFNSAAIALYPILNYMGFQEVRFMGMDMSLLGSMEYSAPYTFRSMLHFWWFMRRNGRVFNANYQANGWLFKRPQSEFDDLRMLWRQAPMQFRRVYEPWKHASPVDGIPTMTLEEAVCN